MRIKIKVKKRGKRKGSAMMAPFVLFSEPSTARRATRKCSSTLDPCCVARDRGRLRERLSSTNGIIRALSPTRRNASLINFLVRNGQKFFFLFSKTFHHFKTIVFFCLRLENVVLSWKEQGTGTGPERRIINIKVADDQLARIPPPILNLTRK